jgi:hypothetical protein
MSNLLNNRKFEVTYIEVCNKYRGGNVKISK